MIIRKEHAIALERLLKDQEERKPYTTIDVDELPTYRELERAGLVRQQTPIRWVLTYSGTELALLLRDLYAWGPKAYTEDEAEVGGELVILEGHGLDKPENWPDDWRWIGSEVIAMLDAAARAERVGPKAEAALMARGLAVRVRDTEKKQEYVILSEAGRHVLEIYLRAHPRLIISEELAEFIRKTPVGPAPADRLPTGSHEEHLLEAMRLIAYSVPASDAFAFTALGQAVKQALTLGGFGTGTVFSEEILWTLSRYVDGEDVSDKSLARLQALGYVGADGELLPAGEWALEAFRLWWDGPRKDVWTLAIEAEEVEVLRTIDTLWKKYEQTGNEDEIPTFYRLRREMIDRKIKEYKALLERYGRRIKEMPKKYQAIAQQFAEAKDLARWYDDNFTLRETLYSLESFNFIQSDEDKRGYEVYTITPIGYQVLEEQAGKERDISSTAVKAITMTRKMFSAPAMDWWQEAHDAGLIGVAEPTKSGWLYAHLAETLTRKPHLTKFEMEVFHVIPARGMTVDEVYDKLQARGEDPERIRWALEKLEARHFIEMLPDGNVVETEAGQLLDEALAGVPEGFGNPVNPIIVRVLEALRSVGTLYVKERKVRVLPRNIEEAWKRSGLSKEAFDNALKAARVAGFIGQNSVTTAGLLLLEVTRAMNPQEELVGFARREWVEG
ncbi:MAG: DUF505 domain-containing protein [Chloroflexi bacterium]|nr:DUF505 domain-containing protein [Chloroflexota bacterium]